MLLIVGALVVIGSVVGGYLMEGGNIAAAQPAGRVPDHRRRGDRQPADLHAATRAEQAASKQIQALLRDGLKRADYTDLLAMLYQLFRVIQQTGVMALEPHFENPARARFCRSIRRS